MKSFRVSLAVLFLCLFSGCATLQGRDAPSVQVVGLNALPSAGLELRFALKIRVQNPNETTLAYDGFSVKLDLDGRGVASGVSNESGEIERFSEQVLTVPVTISAFAALRQLLGHVTDSRSDSEAPGQPIVYSLSGKLGAAQGGSAATRFVDRGELDLFSAGADIPVQ